MPGRWPPGKLKAVAAAWAGGRGGQWARDSDAGSQGAILPDWMMERQRDAIVEVAERDADLVALFMALETQWRFAMTGHRLGIDYAAIVPTAGLYGIQTSPTMMADLRVMEIAAIEEFARKSRR